MLFLVCQCNTHIWKNYTTPMTAKMKNLWFWSRTIHVHCIYSWHCTYKCIHVGTVWGALKLFMFAFHFHAIFSFSVQCSHLGTPTTPDPEAVYVFLPQLVLCVCSIFLHAASSIMAVDWLLLFPPFPHRENKLNQHQLNNALPCRRIYTRCM